jgi:hypothetical protein
LDVETNTVECKFNGIIRPTKRRWTKRSMDGVKEFSALKTEAEDCYETSVRLCCTFGRHVPEDKKLSSQRQET